ncbi:MAG: YqgE/AlgH family protein [Bacteroidales bacterium]|nr:YqgE/AlgH family protein [Bacteroidales bacterium]
MSINPALFRIESNNMPPEKGRLLLAEPFLPDLNFRRAVIILIEHNENGTMGIVLNHQFSKLTLNKVIKDLSVNAEIPLFNGGPVSNDTLFYLHTFDNVPGSLPIQEGLYLNGNFDLIKTMLEEGEDIEGKIRFFLGCSGWGYEQLQRELKQNSWIVTEEKTEILLNPNTSDLWEEVMTNQGGKYSIWAKYPLSIESN